MVGLCEPTPFPAKTRPGRGSPTCGRVSSPRPHCSSRSERLGPSRCYPGPAFARPVSATTKAIATKLAQDRSEIGGSRREAVRSDGSPPARQPASVHSVNTHMPRCRPNCERLRPPGVLGQRAQLLLRSLLTVGLDGSDAARGRAERPMMRTAGANAAGHLQDQRWTHCPQVLAASRNSLKTKGRNGGESGIRTLDECLESVTYRLHDA